VELAQRGTLARSQTAAFLPVHVMSEAAAARPTNLKPTPSPRLTQAAGGKIEIVLADGSQLRVDSDVSLVALRRVMMALRG
jgi:hypothetical protein